MEISQPINTAGSEGATQLAKRSKPSQKALKADLENGARLFVAFCLTCFCV